jgi:hypothetical protein
MQIVRLLLDGWSFFHNTVDINAKNLTGFRALDKLRGQINNSKIRNMLCRTVNSYKDFFISPVPILNKLRILRFRQLVSPFMKEELMEKKNNWENIKLFLMLSPFIKKLIVFSV